MKRKHSSVFNFHIVQKKIEHNGFIDNCYILDNFDVLRPQK